MHFIISLDYHVEEISLATTKSCVLVTMFDHLTCVIAFVELMQKSEKDKSIYFKSRHKKIHLKKSMYSCIYDQRFKYVGVLFYCWCDRCVGIRTFA